MPKPRSREGRRFGVLQAAQRSAVHLTTAERGGEPPPGQARYSLTSDAARRVIRVEPWSDTVLHPVC